MEGEKSERDRRKEETEARRKEKRKFLGEKEEGIKTLKRRS